MRAVYLDPKVHRAQLQYKLRAHFSKVYSSTVNNNISKSESLLFFMILRSKIFCVTKVVAVRKDKSFL